MMSRLTSAAVADLANIERTGRTRRRRGRGREKEGSEEEEEEAACCMPAWS